MAIAIRRHISSRGLHDSKPMSVFLDGVSNLRFIIRGMSSIARFTKRSTICISKICGFLSSAIQQTSRRLGWRYMRLVMHGGSSVSFVSLPCLRW
jgi:hypothetical protein